MKTTLLKIILLTILLIIFASCQDCCPDGEPNGSISEAKAIDMHNLYIATFSETIDQVAGTQQPKQTNFDIEDLEKYICKIKDSASLLGHNGILGLSVYYGAKTNESGEIELSVFFSPTNKEGETICNISDITRLNLGSAWEPPSLFTICEPTD